MKLLGLKLLSPFRGLSEGFEIRFSEREHSLGLEPYCFVGLNGSGKSNVIEVLAEVFYYLERYARGEVRDVRKSKKVSRNFGFIIEYTYDLYRCLELSSALPGFSSDYDKVTTGFKIRIFKPPTGKLEVSIHEEGHNYSRPKSARDRREWVQVLLPNRIVAYSSGANEVLSAPFHKMEMVYHDQLVELSINPEITDVGKVSMDRLFYMDYESNKMLLLSNFLLRESPRRSWAGVSRLCELVGIEDLHSFSITIRARENDKELRGAPSQIAGYVSFLKACATTQYERIEAGRQVQRLDFYVDRALRSGFADKFNGSAFRLYECLYALRLLNVSLLRRELRSQIKDAGPGTNVGSLLPRYGSQDLLFQIDDIRMRKKDVSEPVQYKHLSDGEHQLLHVMGALAMMDDSGTLFLLDEPETHFNPEWRANFIRLLNESIGQAPDRAKREQEVLLSTHSPFIVSDCQKDRVYRFQRNQNDRSKVVYETAAEMGFNTFGASVDLITAKLFDYDMSFGSKANEKLEGLRDELRSGEKPPAEVIKEAYDDLGESAERVFLINEAIHKRNEDDPPPEQTPAPKPVPRPVEMA